MQKKSTCHSSFILVYILLLNLPRIILSNIVVAGSANLDTFLPIHRLPQPGENLTLLPHRFPITDVPGGKGCNQAIACRKLSFQKCSFVGRIGCDEGGDMIQRVLVEHQVNVDHLKRSLGLPTGRGYVFLEQDTGKVSAIVSGGSNLYGWGDFQEMAGEEVDLLLQQLLLLDDVTSADERVGVSGTKHCLLLQREVPEFVNQKLAECAKKKSNIIVLQDIGGEDRNISREMLTLCDYIMPNLTELQRLVRSLDTDNEYNHNDNLTLQQQKQQPLDPTNQSLIIEFAKKLQQYGANNVLVTMGEHGSLLVQSDGHVIFQQACNLDEDDTMRVVDETGAGDCFRAAFAVALSERTIEGDGDSDGTSEDEKVSIQECMKFASAAGALAVTKQGAVPSIPSRDEVYELLKKQKDDAFHRVHDIPRGGAGEDGDHEGGGEEFPYMFGSRLNSMKDRPELWPAPLHDVREWVKRQGTVRGLGCVDFNYPQHFTSWSSAEARLALEEVGLVAGAVCLRYPAKFARGAMNHPDQAMRREAIEMTKDAARTARELGCNEVVVWSAYDGYDYPFQVDYREKWQQLVEAFQECCDAFPDIKWSLEYKPTDENTRFFTVPSTGAALLLVKEIDRPNMGLTLDVGHMLMSGENPGQSISMVGDKLFGIQLNDGYTRLAAEDGMMFGSIHPTMALEIMYQLQKIHFSGHFYFDTFPQRSDPVKEAEYNIESAKRFYKAAKMMTNKGTIKQIMEEHDAIAAMNLVNEVLKM